MKTSGQSKTEAKALAKQLEIVGDAQVKISELQAKARKILEQSKLTFENFHKGSARHIRAAIFGFDKDCKVQEKIVIPNNSLFVTNVDI